MKTVDTLNLKTKKTIKFNYKLLLFIAAAIFLLGPFTGISSMYGMVGDTAIQIKTGMEGISSGHLMLDEVYSWHPDLVWTAHEEGWYFLLGAMYKLLGLAGVILVGVIFNYGTAFLIINRIKDKVHPLMAAAVMILIPFLNGFPDYNVRPSVTSAFCITLLIVTELAGKSRLTKSLVFAISAYALAWLHGGILPVFFAVYALFGVIELLYKNWRETLWHLAMIVITFGLTLLNPIGIRIYTFGLKQMGATDIWQYVQEWQPTTFSILQLILVLLLFIGFMASDKVKKFDKEAITKLALVCMFFIMACVYTRFLLYFSIAYLLVAPELFTDILAWLNENVFHIKTDKLVLSNMFYGLIAAICLGLFAFTGVTYSIQYFKTNSMTDVEAMAAYDKGAVDYVKSHGYERIYNSFNTGSWLAFYDVPVHIDNRIDPFMEEYSGVDHIRGKMYMGSVSDLDRFHSEYNNDAFLIDMGAGYSSLVTEVEQSASDRYEVVYDNTVVSNLTDSIANRWVIIECK